MATNALSISPVIRRWRVGWRGPHLAIWVVLGALAINLGTYSRTLPIEWPLVVWQMYGNQGPKPPVAKYRRFLTHRANGQVSDAEFSDSLGFLDKAYRIDAGLKKGQSAFLSTVLRELHEDDPDITGLSFEKRSWAYDRQTLDEHLREPPVSAFRVMVVAPPPSELRASLRGTRLENGDFEGWGAGADPGPNHWKAADSSLGVGVSNFIHWDRSALLAAAPASKWRSLRQKVRVAVAEHESARALHATALVRAEAKGASLQLQVAVDGAKPLTLRAHAPGDAEWHRLDVSHAVPAGADAKLSATVILLSSGAADVYFDDVALFTEPAPIEPTFGLSP